MKSEIDILVEELLANELAVEELLAAGEATYSDTHEAAMRVPKGGSSCASCEYLGKDGKSCTNKYFIKYHGSEELPYPADEFCSDWYWPKEKLEAAGTSEGVRKAWDTRGRGRHANPHRPGSAIRRLMDLARRPEGVNINEAMGKLGVQRWVLSFVRNGEGNGFRWQVIDNGMRSGVLKVGTPTPAPASTPAPAPRVAPPPLTSTPIPTPIPTPTTSTSQRVPETVRVGSGTANAGLLVLRDGEWHDRSEFDRAIASYNRAHGYTFDPQDRLNRLRDGLTSQNYRLETSGDRLRVVPSFTPPSSTTTETSTAPRPTFDQASVPQRIDNPSPGQRQPVGFLTKDPATFNEAGTGPGRVNISPEDKDRFQSSFKMSPEQFKSVILRGVPENLANASVRLNSSQHGEVWQLGVEGPGWSMSRTFNFQNKSVYHGYFSMDENLQGHGLGKQMFTNLFDVYDHLGMKTVGVSASLSNGGYAWARFGFIPNASDWSSVSNNALHRAERDSSLTPDIKAQVRLIAGITNPKAIWLLAGLKDANGKSVGATLLRGQDWHGKIDLDNPEQYAVVRDYSGRKKA